MDALNTYSRNLCCKLSWPQQSEETDLVLETIVQATIPPLDQGCCRWQLRAGRRSLAVEAMTAVN